MFVYIAIGNSISLLPFSELAACLFNILYYHWPDAIYNPSYVKTTQATIRLSINLTGLSAANELAITEKLYFRFQCWYLYLYKLLYTYL